MAIITVSNTGGNWNATGTWVGGVLPLTTDTIAFTATSGSLTVNVASTCAGFDMTNYSAGKTITFTSDLTVNGPWNLGSGAYTQAGAGRIIIGASGTITSNGVTWNRGIVFGSIGTGSIITLAGDLTVSGLVYMSPTVTMSFLGSYNINILGGLSYISAVNTTSSSTTFIFKSGTWNHTAAGYLQTPITINPTGTLTLGTNQYIGNTTISYSAGGGSLVTIGSTLNSNGALTFSSSASVITWNNITLLGTSQTFTLGSDLNVGGLLTLSPVTTMVFAGAYNINVLGGLTVSGTAGAVISGASTPFIIKGGTVNYTVASFITNTFTVTPSTPVTLTNIYANGSTINYVAGVSTVTCNGTLFINTGTSTFNTGVMVWNNISIGGLPTATLSSDFHWSGTYTPANTGGGCTFNGNYVVYGVSFNFTISVSQYIAGTGGATLVINATGTINGYAASGGANTGFRLPTNINHSGTTTINSISIQGGFPFTRTSGSISFSGTLFIQNGTCTFTGFAGVTISNVNINSGGIGCTAIFDFTTISGTLTTAYSPIIQDASGFTVGTFIMVTTSVPFNIVLVATHTYTITTSITSTTSTAAAHIGFQSSSPGTRYTFTLQQGATQDLPFIYFTDADASLGKTIATYKGTISNCLNIKNLPLDVQPIGA